MDLTGKQHGVDDGGPVSGFGGADEEPVFLSDGRRTYFVFDEVVIDLGLSGMIGAHVEEAPSGMCPTALAKIAARSLSAIF